MIKTYETCYLGKVANTTIGIAHKFKVTQIVEVSEENPSGKILETIQIPYLIFKNTPIKGLEIGDYLSMETENNSQFKKWRRCLRPSARLSDEEIFQYVIEEKAIAMERKALAEFRHDKIRLERILKRVKTAMEDLSPSQKAAFALYVYQYLLK